MTLNELKQAVDDAIEKAKEYGESADDIIVSLQIDQCDAVGDEVATYGSDEVELHYDGNGTASGCVLVGLSN